MFIVYYKLGKEACVKHFNVKHEAIDFAEMQDNDDGTVKIIHCDPTSPEPVAISFDTMLNKAGITTEPLVMPVHSMDRPNKLGKVKDLLSDTCYEANCDGDECNDKPLINGLYTIKESFEQNEVHLLIEEAMGKFFQVANGLVEQIKRITGGYNEKNVN